MNLIDVLLILLEQKIEVSFSLDKDAFMQAVNILLVDRSRVNTRTFEICVDLASSECFRLGKDEHIAMALRKAGAKLL